MEEYRPDPASIAGKSLEVAEHAQLLVIGGGPAGLAAALEAARLGMGVVLVDENPIPPESMGEDVPLLFGQRMGGVVRNRTAMLEAVLASDPAIEAAFDAGIDVRLGTVAWGLYANGPSVGWLPGPVAGLADGERSWMIGCERIIVAAGGRDMGLAFPGWELPGVLGVTAARRLLDRYAALDARRAVVLGSTAEALSAALALRDAGIGIAAVVEQAAGPIGPAALVQALAGRGVPILCGHAPRQARGGLEGVELLIVAQVAANGRPVAGTEQVLACDTILLGVGTVPVVELLDAAGCRIAFRPERGGYAPVLDAAQRSSIAEVYAVGDCAGIWPDKSLSADIARAEGRRAAADAAASRGLAAQDATAPALPPQVSYDLAAYRLAWVRAGVVEAAGEPHVCRCEEVTAREILEVRPPRYLGWAADRRNDRDLRSLLGEGPPNPDQVKRLTRAGMGLCQGRRCREQVAALLALGSGMELGAIPLASYRAPVRPLPLRLAGQGQETAEMAAHWDTWFGMASQVPAVLGHPRAVHRRRPGRGRAGGKRMSTTRRESGPAETPRGAAVVIIGGGVTGLSAGWWLARQGIDVLVVDKGLVGWEASGRNGGGCSHHFSPLFREEQRLWPLMDELLGYPTEFRSGRIRLAFTEEQMVLYRRAVENAARQGFASEVLDARQARDLVPLAGDGIAGGYLYRFGGHANPHRTVQAYAWAMQDHGGRLLQHTTVEGFEVSGERVTGVRTSRGVLGCETLVLAAGPQTGLLSRRLGSEVPMAPARAEMVVTEPLPLMPVGGVDGNGLYGRQTLRGNLAYGGGPHEWLDFEGNLVPPRSSTPLMRNIAARLGQLLPKAGHARIIRSWAGIIENTPDGRPVIDRLPTARNAIVATMSSVGFGLSPASGRAIAELVVAGACGFADIGTFALSRFARLEADWIARQGWRTTATTAEQRLAGA